MPSPYLLYLVSPNYSTSTLSHHLYYNAPKSYDQALLSTCFPIPLSKINYFFTWIIYNWVKLKMPKIDQFSLHFKFLQIVSCFQQASILGTLNPPQIFNLLCLLYIILSRLPSTTDPKLMFLQLFPLTISLCFTFLGCYCSKSYFL